MIRPNQDAINKLVELYQSGNLEETETKAKELLNDVVNPVCKNLFGERRCWWRWGS